MAGAPKRAHHPKFPLPGPDPGIHASVETMWSPNKAWMPGSGPGKGSLVVLGGFPAIDFALPGSAALFWEC
jgi:hypothetical protein